MPLYEFVCKNCNVRVELLVSGDQKPICPECGKAKMERQLSVIAAPTTNKSSGATDGDCGAPQCGGGGGG